MRRYIFGLLAIAAASACLFVQPASAADYRTPAVGGDGGAPFTMRCAQGDYLVGVRVRSGDWVDAIAPLCANWQGGDPAFLPWDAGPMRGGGGGGVADFYCDRSSVITGMIAEPAPNQWSSVAMMDPWCAPASNPTRRSAGTGPEHFGKGIADRRIEAETDPNVGTSVSITYDMSRMPICRSGDVAVGIYGAAGNYLDRIGLICAPAPRVIIMMPPINTGPSPGDIVHEAPPIHTGPNPGDIVREPPSVLINAPRCRSGFVWREASPSDYVCVTPESRDRVRRENAVASTRVNPQGAYGPNTCIGGFVWREAYQGDVVCVTPEVRDTVRQENATAASRTL